MSETTTFKNARRDHRSFLYTVEKRALVWMAERMPAAINPDHLTVLGLLAMLGCGAAYALAPRHPLFLTVASGCLVLNWFGDSLDGTLARVRDQCRPRYGFYVDHMVDAFGTFSLLGGLALSGFMTPLIALGVLIAYFLLNIEVYLATYTLGTFKLSFWKFSPTELRILLIIGNVALLTHPRVTVFGVHARLFDVGGIVAIIALGLVAISTTIRHTRELYRQETHR